MNPEVLVREFCTAWSKLDADVLVDYFTEDGVYHNIPLEPLSGREAIRGFLAGFLAGCDSVEFRIGHLLVSGSVVMTERVDAFRMGGRDIALPVAGVFEVRDGKIAAWRDYFDMGQVTAALQS